MDTASICDKEANCLGDREVGFGHRFPSPDGPEANLTVLGQQLASTGALTRLATDGLAIATSCVVASCGGYEFWNRFEAWCT